MKNNYNFLVLFLCFIICTNASNFHFENNHIIQEKNLFNTNKLKKSEASKIKYRTNNSDIPQVWSASGICLVLIEDKFYNIYKLINKKISILSQNGYIIEFNPCKDLKTDNGKRAMVVNKSKDIRFSGNFLEDKLWSVNNNKLYLELSSGQSCNDDETKLYKTIVIMKCNPTINEPIIRNSPNGIDTFDKNKCENVIKIESKYSCPERYYIWWNEMGLSDQQAGIFLILVGIFFLIFGETFTFVSSTIICTFGMCFVTKSVLEIFISIPLIHTIVIGFVFGILSGISTTMRYLSLSIVLGFLLGNVLNTFMLQIILLDPYVLYWICVAVSFILMIIISSLITKYMLIFICSLIGGYSIIRGISFFLGGFPEENLLTMLIAYGEYNQISSLMNNTNLIYIGSMIGTGILGCIIQGYFTTSVKSKEQKDDKILIVEDK